MVPPMYSAFLPSTANNADCETKSTQTVAAMNLLVKRMGETSTKIEYQPVLLLASCLDCVGLRSERSTRARSLMCVIVTLAVVVVATIRVDPPAVCEGGPIR